MVQSFKDVQNWYVVMPMRKTQQTWKTGAEERGSTVLKCGRVRQERLSVTRIIGCLQK